MAKTNHCHYTPQFLSLVTFYQWFVKSFRTIAAHLTNCLKHGSYQRGSEQEESFTELKNHLTNASVLALPSFEKVFEVETNTSMIGIGAVFKQEGCSIEFSTKNYVMLKEKSSTYEHELYALVRTLDHWKHYLLEKRVHSSKWSPCSLILEVKEAN